MYLHLRVHLLMKTLYKRKFIGIKELSPGVRSLQIRYDNFIITQKQLIKILIDQEDILDNIDEIKIFSRII
ncbi:carboxyltransferase domain-containing protein [Candidatus Pantoea edessiphila]|uniref:carboxyltransferase domain-containing protein n=1 Tax=Candidatus Pantoea edessiphila TaxID=2044610 RepID=UPI001F540FF6